MRRIERTGTICRFASINATSAEASPLTTASVNSASAGDGELRILNRERGIANCRIRNALGQPEDLVLEETGMLAMEDLNGPRIGGAMGVEEFPGLVLIGGERGGKRQD